MKNALMNTYISLRSPIQALKTSQQSIKGLRWWILGLLVLAMINSYIDRGNISMAAPLITDYFNLDAKMKGYIFSSFLLGYALMQIPAGMMVDRFGIKLTYTIAFIVWGITAATFGIATAFWHLIALRILLGIWESISGPAGNAYVGRYFDENERGFASGLLLSGSKFGPAIGAIVAGVLLESYGWQMLFILCGLVPLIWVLPWWSLYKKQEQLELKNQASENKLTAQSDTQTGTKTRRASLTKLLQNKKIQGIFLGYFCYGYVWFLYISWLPSYLYDELGFSIKETGWWAGFAYGSLAIVVIVAGYLSDVFIRRGHCPTKVRKSFVIAGFLTGSLIIPVPFIENAQYAMYLVIITISGMGLATANTWAISQTIAPRGSIGTVAGIQNFAATFGGFFAPIITGYFIEVSGSYMSAFVLAGILMLLGIFSYVFLIGKIEEIQFD
ncbi:MFS transporter [Thalassotalea fonticola]|uniref:MFS transporter n=1 Tax=Thalassotalea fonticola TaxID=3065649 RepID=A0ABZ0GII7_9GAMM|nr:MFS transporter [Colwelliaceae bacterium S1-1]